MGHIKFNDVGFSYPQRPHQQVLNGINFEIQPSQTIALCGLSGAGMGNRCMLTIF